MNKLLLGMLTGVIAFSTFGCTSEKSAKKNESPGPSVAPSSNNAQMNKPVTCESPFNSRVMTAQDFIDAYKKNPIVFDATYKGKCVALWGLVSEMTSTTGYALTLRPVSVTKVTKKDTNSGWNWYYEKGDSLPEIKFYLPKDEVSQLSDIAIGKSLAIFMGKVIGAIDGISIGIKDSRMYDAPMPYRASRCISILKEKADQLAQKYISGEYTDHIGTMVASAKKGVRRYNSNMGNGNVCADIPDLIPRSYDAP